MLLNPRLDVDVIIHIKLGCYYAYRDLSGNPVSKHEAKATIRARWAIVSYS